MHRLAARAETIQALSLFRLQWNAEEKSPMVSVLDVPLSSHSHLLLGPPFL